MDFLQRQKSGVPWLDLHCRKCRAAFSSPSEAADHSCYKRPRDKPKKECPHCQQTFKDRWHLTRHVLTHGLAGDGKSDMNKRFTCGVCARGFVSSVHYRKHMDWHQGGREDSSELECDETDSDSGGPVADTEIVPVCRICGADVESKLIPKHSLEHVPDLFEEVRPVEEEMVEAGEGCDACEARQAQAEIMMEVLNGHYTLSAYLLSKVIGAGKGR